ncbi:uncharacterized protein [Vulpes vulpes]|uniref:Uncharacterized protein n=1 Tax=Vulpes vulpes TaxID=9627 RepID=A0ABM4XTH6_VULVU
MSGESRIINLRKDGSSGGNAGWRGRSWDLGGGGAPRAGLGLGPGGAEGGGGGRSGVGGAAPEGLQKSCGDRSGSSRGAAGVGSARRVQSGQSGRRAPGAAGSPRPVSRGCVGPRARCWRAAGHSLQIWLAEQRAPLEGKCGLQQPLPAKSGHVTWSCPVGCEGWPGSGALEGCAGPSERGVACALCSWWAAVHCRAFAAMQTWVPSTWMPVSVAASWAVTLNRKLLPGMANPLNMRAAGRALLLSFGNWTYFYIN